MPSPRSRFESTCRIGAFALLGWLLGGSLVRSSSRRVEHVATCAPESSGCDETVSRRLSVLTRIPDELIHLDAYTAPPAWATDWLAAMARAGIPVSWSGPAPATGLSIQAVASPRNAVRIDVAAPAGSMVRLDDESGELDRVRIADLGATVVASSVVGEVTANVAGQTMRGAVPDPASRRDVMVLGAAGWEGKFIAAALEESGWRVAARFVVAPGIDVTTDPAATLDTSKIGVVIALDSSVRALGAALERFVRSGGGLILAGPAAGTPSVADLAPGQVGARTRPALQSRDTMRLGATGFYPVVQLRPGAIALERRAGGVAVAAMRMGAGRVLQVGYDDSWRWRLAGVSGADEAHRQWWTRAVESVAYVPATRRLVDVADAAPLAHQVDRLGASRPAPAPRGSGVDPRILMTLIMILLLTEWTSRRLRGLR